MEATLTRRPTHMQCVHDIRSSEEIDPCHDQRWPCSVCAHTNTHTGNDDTQWTLQYIQYTNYINIYIQCKFYTYVHIRTYKLYTIHIVWTVHMYIHDCLCLKPHVEHIDKIRGSWYDVLKLCVRETLVLIKVALSHHSFNDHLQLFISQLRISEAFQRSLQVCRPNVAIVVKVIDSEGIGCLQIPRCFVAECREHVQQVFKRNRAIFTCWEDLADSLPKRVFLQLWHACHFFDGEASDCVSAMRVYLCWVELTEAVVELKDLSLWKERALLILVEVRTVKNTLIVSHLAHWYRLTYALCRGIHMQVLQVSEFTVKLRM